MWYNWDNNQLIIQGTGEVSYECRQYNVRFFVMSMISVPGLSVTVKAHLPPADTGGAWFPRSHLTLSGVMTIVILFHLSGYRCFKWYYREYVCHNRCISRHKVFKGYAERGKKFNRMVLRVQTAPDNQ
jgi:hypothetical protein